MANSMCLGVWCVWCAVREGEGRREHNIYLTSIFNDGQTKDINLFDGDTKFWLLPLPLFQK